MLLNCHRELYRRHLFTAVAGHYPRPRAFAASSRRIAAVRAPKVRVVDPGAG